jgi:hypothetical protein
MECVGRLGESFMYESQPEVYIAYNFVIKECRVVVILSGEFIFMHLHTFPVLNQNLCGHKLKYDCKMDTILTGWLMTQEMDLLSTGGLIG